MPSFNNIDLGDCTVIATDTLPVELQMNAYPGVDGLEVLFGGARGGHSVAYGIWFGADESEIAAIQQTWIAMQQVAVLATLIDSKGQPWPNVIVTDVRVTGPMEEGDDFIGLVQPFMVEFLHIGGGN